MVSSIDHAVDLVTAIWRLPGNADYQEATRIHAEAVGLPAMVRNRDSPALFGWLMESFSYQGISDRIAADYINRHGNARYRGLAQALADTREACPKLANHHTYVGCGYRKAARTCANPSCLAACPVPSLHLRKGDLNQLAFSLFFLVRDRCQGDVVGFIDGLFAEVEERGEADPVTAKRQSLVDAFSGVHAVSAKLINMAFAVLLTAGNPTRPDWVAVGQSMVAIDTLVHNFLRRTGILEAFGREHVYGPACYGPGGCAVIIYELTDLIAVRQAGDSPATLFPRLIQFAIWSFCAQSKLDICNGRRIDDRFSCRRDDCPVGELCSRTPARPTKPVVSEPLP